MTSYHIKSIHPINKRPVVNDEWDNRGPSYWPAVLFIAVALIVIGFLCRGMV